MATDNMEPIGQQTAKPLQRQWPQLGREIYSLERALAAHLVTYGHTLSENEKMERAERFRNRVFAQLYNDDEKYSPETRYRAFLVVRHGKAGEIVGNPYYVDAYGEQQELPYTGLEGYYAGSIRTSEYPGMAPEDVIQEEAHIGVEMLRTIKKHAIERYTWASFAKMKKGLESEDRREQERQARKERERIRRERLKVYNHFRDATYAILKEAGDVTGEYDIQVNDSQWTDATIIETILLPKTQSRNDFASTRVTLTSQQLEGYLFLTELGDIGGDPIARTVLSST